MLRLKVAQGAVKATGQSMDHAHGRTAIRSLLCCLALALGVLFGLPAFAAANPITDENALPGTSGWEVSQADSPLIDGYTSSTSVAPGGTIGFHVSTNPAANYRINIYRLGWYNGAGARLVACLGNVAQVPPNCTSDRSGIAKTTPSPNGQTGQIDAGWSQSTSWTVPANATTGEYVAEYVLRSGTQSGFARYSQFVVRSNAPPASKSSILVVVPFNTYLAYNVWGGTSAYENTTSQSGPFPPSLHDHATKVSFNRPFHRREWRFWDLNLVRFLEREGYDVSYVSDTDVDANPNILLEHRAVIVSGHSEYWTKAMRNGFDAARDAGTNILFAGANDAYWQVRYEDSSCADDNTVCATVGDRRTMVIYKGPNEGPDDPAPGTADDTSKFRELGRPECELQGGVMYGSWFPNDGYRNYTTTADGASDPWAAGTGLAAGSTITGLVGFEFDSYFPDCEPPGTPKILFTYQGPETSAQHDSAAVKYIANGSGARVFSSGTEQWSWGLDSYRWDPNLFTGIPPTNAAIQQFTRNMLGDMVDPAAPAGVSAVKSGNSINIDTSPRNDSRVISYKVYRHAGTAAFQPGDAGVTLVCQNASGDCTDAPANGTYRYASVAVDQWNDSAPALSSAVTLTTPVTAVDDSATISEDASATAIDVLANDTPGAATKTITAVAQPANGQVVITGGGSGLTYLPSQNYCNNPPGSSPDTFTYTVNAESTATVSVAVNCVDDAPVALRDPVSVVEDDPATQINVLANDTDVDGGPKTVDSVTQPAHGTVVRNGDGSGLTYQPNANYCNFVNGQGSVGPTDDFTYTLNGGSIATVAMTVDCRSDVPVANDDSATVTEDDAATAINVLSNDTDAEGDPITIASRTQATHGNVVLTGGTAGAHTGLTYQPAGNYCGPDSFTYTVNGGDTATVSVTVTCVNDPANALDDAQSVGEDSAATAIDVLGNDADAEGDAITISSSTQPANGTVVLTGGSPGARTGLTYLPNANYCNNPPAVPADTFSYTVNGGDTATVSVTVSCVNDLPNADDDTATLNEDAGATALPVLSNDDDVENDPITITGRTQPTNGAVVITGGGTGLTYQPHLNYCNNPPGSSPDTFTYTVNGGDTATVSVTVNCVDDAPTAVRDPVSVVEDDPATQIDVLGNDTDIDGGPKTVNSVTQPANGTVVRNSDGSGLTYKPPANYCNFPGSAPSDDFTYTLNGGSTATVSMTVDCVNDQPVAADDNATVSEDDPATAVPVLSNDTDVENDPITISSKTNGTHGTVQITGGGTGLTYQPNANHCGSDSFTYTVNGGDTATVSVTVTCADDAPAAVDDTKTVTEDDDATAIDVLGNDTDVDAGPKTIDSAGDPARGTVVIAGGGTGLTYQPDPNYCNNPPGTNLDTFDYTLNGGDSATVSVTVNCVNDLPVAADDNATVGEDDPATAIAVLANDTDVENDPITVGSKTNGTHGTVQITGGGTGLTYQPNANYCGPDSFTYTINGGDDATVSLTVTCVGDDPVAADDAKTVTEDDAATSIDVLGNDTDIDAGPKSVNSVDTTGTNGQVVITGGGSGLTYKPNANYCNNPPGSNPDTFTYALNGGSQATVSVTVNCVNDPPKADDDTASISEDAGATAIPVLSNDDDVEGDTITISSKTDPAHGTVQITGGGTGLTYEPNPNYCNNPPTVPADSFTYAVNGDSPDKTAAVSVTVNCVDDPPQATNDVAAVTEDDPATAVPVLDNDNDVEGDPITISSSTQPTNGTVVLTGGSAGARTGLTYQPNPNYCNNPPAVPGDTFTYTVNGDSPDKTATVSITVDCVNDLPSAVNDAASVLHDSSATTIPVLSNDDDPEGDPIAISSAGSPANGTVVLFGGTPGARTGLTYQPNPGYCNDGSPTDNFSYTLNGGATAMVLMTVTCAPPPTSNTVPTAPVTKKCKKGFKKVKGKCRKKKRKRK